MRRPSIDQELGAPRKKGVSSLASDTHMTWRILPLIGDSSNHICSPFHTHTHTPPVDALLCLRLSYWSTVPMFLFSCVSEYLAPRSFHLEGQKLDNQQVATVGLVSHLEM